jgi:hypothetical protein
MKKVKKSVKKNKEYHLLVYVEKAALKIKRFETTQELGEFIDAFNKKHPEYANDNSDYWTDFAVTGVTGETYFFTDGLKVE